LRYPIDQINLLLYCLPFPFASNFSNLLLVSSFVSTSIEGVLGGLAGPRETLRVPLKDRLGDQRGGGEWELIKFFPKDELGLCPNFTT
jgi:hypothetical protein